MASAIKPIYTAPSAEAALAELDAFAQGPWGEKFPTVVAAWRRAWDRVIPFFAFPPPIRSDEFAHASDEASSDACGHVFIKPSNPPDSMRFSAFFDVT